VTISSAAETILAYVATLLGNVPGGSFFRSRPESIERQDGIVVNLLPRDENMEQVNDDLEKCDLVFELRVTARGAVPDQLADPVVQACHMAIMADKTLGGRCSKLIRFKKEWDISEADLNAAVVVIQYRARYMTKVNDGSIVQ
jgi:hypothetical protein